MNATNLKSGFYGTDSNTYFVSDAGRSWAWHPELWKGSRWEEDLLHWNYREELLADERARCQASEAAGYSFAEHRARPRPRP